MGLLGVFGALNRIQKIEVSLVQYICMRDLMHYESHPRYSFKFIFETVVLLYMHVKSVNFER